MHRHLLVAGGGIGGLAAAVAAGRAGWRVRIFERAPALSEIGAGLQLGPNATRLLLAWGLGGRLDDLAAFPSRLAVRSAVHGGELSGIRLGADMRRRYGAPYATLHRADLHALLLEAATSTGAQLRTGMPVQGFTESPAAITAHLADGERADGDALLAADGVWSELRQSVLDDGTAQPSGHLAYRSLVLQSELPPGLRSAEVTAWLGPDLHAVTYPVRRGELLNVVVFARGRTDPSGEGLQGWDQSAVAGDLRHALAGACAPLRDLVEAMPAWRRWVVSDRAPMRGPGEMALGRAALLGDAAHPMLPYLAQGAGMALEDAAVLGQVLGELKQDARAVEIHAALRRYAELRWRRASRVQARARRNGWVFHTTGAVRIARDAALRLMGARLLDMPWLYGGGR